MAASMAELVVYGTGTLTVLRSCCIKWHPKGFVNSLYVGRKGGPTGVCTFVSQITAPVVPLYSI